MNPLLTIDSLLMITKSWRHIASILVASIPTTEASLAMRIACSCRSKVIVAQSCSLLYECPIAPVKVGSLVSM